MKKLLLASAVLLATPICAFANTFVLHETGTLNGLPIDASATITTGAGTLTITFTDNVVNPTSDIQLISGIFVTLGTTPTSATIGSITGTEISIPSGTPTGNAISHWGADVTGSKVCLAAAFSPCAPGAKPFDQVIGDPGPSGYTNANPSITNHDPSVKNSPTFVLDVGGGITAATVISSAFMTYGTAGDSLGVPGPIVGAGLPGLLAACGGLLALARRRRQKAA